MRRSLMRESGRGSFRKVWRTNCSLLPVTVRSDQSQTFACGTQSRKAVQISWMGGPGWPVAQPAKRQVKAGSTQSALEVSSQALGPPGPLVLKLTVRGEVIKRAI